MLKNFSTLIIIIYLIMLPALAKAISCTQYLGAHSSLDLNEHSPESNFAIASSDQSHFSIPPAMHFGDVFRHPRVWQEFALTDPKGSMSVKARSKLIEYYNIHIKQHVLKFAEVQSLNIDQQNQLNNDLTIKVHEWINNHQKYIYERFEISKTFRESDPSFYQSEILALREIIDNMQGLLESLIQDFLNSLI